MSRFAVRRLSATGFLLAAAITCLGALPAVSQAAPCDAPGTNPIACENTLAGNPRSEWEIDGAGDETIQGFATQMSVNKGESVSLKIKAPTTNYSIRIFRLGYYAGNGARLIAGPLSPTSPNTNQPACLNNSTGLIDCGNWTVSRTWAVPASAVSGVYIAHLRRNDTQGESHITFVVRDDASTSPVVLQTSDATWQAYNTYGGNSLYHCEVNCPDGNPSTYKAAYKVSYNRPLNTAEDDGGRSALFTGAEYSMIRFLERAGYNMTYTSQIDTQARGNLIRNHKLFISSGHDEYWSKAQRTNVETARDAGVNLAFFSGNEIFWKTRYESSIDGSSTANRTLVSYKDTHFTAQEDPVEWTGTWRDPRFTAPADRPTPENALTGQSFLVNLGTSAIKVPFEYKNLRMWRNTPVARLTSGQSVTLAASTLCYEWDVDADNGFRPAGQFRLSSTTVSGLEVFTDYGSTVKTNGTATHNLTAYRAPSGALVFGAGTVQWAWGLDSWNPLQTAPNLTQQQATVNLFADQNAQPGTLANLPGVVAATKSSDVAKPTSAITSPAAGANLTDGQTVTISGTASDSGGAVAGVEVSTDSGQSWHPAKTGTSSWTYTWIAHGSPTSTIRTRASDDSGNTEVPSAGRTVNVACPCSLWGNAITPEVADAGDLNAAELGVKFISEQFGKITGIRFYKASANGGTHVGSLWTATGTRLAQVTFTGETGSGWQTATFSSPVDVDPNTTYIASYYAPNGHFSATPEYFYPTPAPGPNGGAIADSKPLHSVRNTSTNGNGVYAYAATSTFPASTFGATNYWVDVVFTPTPAPGQVTNATATSGGTSSANVTWNAPATGGQPRSYVITPRINGTAQTSLAKTITGSPPLTTTTVTGLTGGTTYTFTVQACNPNGCGAASAASNTVKPGQAVVPAAPTAVDARPATSSARVSWNVPSSDGGSAITGYTITPIVGGVAQTATTVGGATTSTTVTGLTNGSTHTFTVKATNGVGSGPASAPSSGATPQATIFDFGEPQTVDSQDGNAVELGTKFTPSVSGTVTGVRFYKAAANTGTHTGSLWTPTGTRLAQVTFSGETSSGWQSATFSSGVSVSAGTTYIVSYHAPLGHYSVTPGGLESATTNGALTALSNATGANGVYGYAAASAFPPSSYNASNYWVDVMFAVAVPGQVTNAAAVAAGASSATVSWSAPSTGGQPDSYVVTPRINGVGQAPRIVTGTPLPTSTTVTGLTQGTTYTFTVAARNANGTGTASTPSNAVKPSQAVVPAAPTSVDAKPASSSARVTWNAPTGDGDSPITGYTITPIVGGAGQPPVTAPASATSATLTGLTNGTSYTFTVKATNVVGSSAASAPSGAVTPRLTIFDFAAPDVADTGDANALELGVKFTPTVSGFITGIRFYKSALNTGTHTASLWSATGTRLGTVTFTGESASGWQTATFPANGIAVTAGTTYVASYLAPNGHYSVSSNQFASSGVTNGPLTALSGPASGGNGVYVYGASGGFPTSSYNNAHYGVDVNFATSPAPGQVTGVTATAGQASANVSWTAPASGGAPSSYIVTPRINGVAQTPTTTVSGSPPATSTTVSGLSSGQAYTFTVAAANAGGTGAASAPSNAVTPTGAQAPSAPTAVSAAANTNAADLSWTAPAANGGSAITGYTITPFIGAAAQTATNVSGPGTSARVTGLTNGTSYTFTVKATNGAGSGPASAPSAAVTPKHSIFDFATPATVDAAEASSVSLGVKFQSSVSGTVTGVRFYKAAANTGTHVGTLWSSTGTQLAQATFSDESDSGWQTVTFSSPVAITAGTTYVASYLSPNGHYSANGSQFSSSGVTNGPLTALANPVGANGVYAYGAASVFPTNSWNSTNYWVDVLFDASA